MVLDLRSRKGRIWKAHALAHRQISKLSTVCFQCLRGQLVPTIKLSVVGTDVTIQRRTKGGITGSGLASALGRIPVYDLIQKREPIWRDWGLKIDDGVLTMSPYIGNIYIYMHWQYLWKVLLKLLQTPKCTFKHCGTCA